MSETIRFQCTFWMRPNWHGKAHACGATFGSLDALIQHRLDAHDIVGQEKRRAARREQEREKAEAQ